MNGSTTVVPAIVAILVVASGAYLFFGDRLEPRPRYVGWIYATPAPSGTRTEISTSRSGARGDVKYRGKIKAAGGFQANWEFVGRRGNGDEYRLHVWKYPNYHRVDPDDEYPVEVTFRYDGESRVVYSNDVFQVRVDERPDESP